MAYRTLFCFTGLLFVILFQEQAYCDGCFIWRNKDIDILQPSQKAIIEWDGKTEILTIQTKYQGPIEEMVWIVPVPAKPEVSKANMEKFKKLSVITQTATLKKTEFISEQADLDTIYLGRMSGDSSPLISRESIGVYDVAILQPKQDEAVLKWLRENQFPINEATAKQIADYDSRNWYIIASRILPESQTAFTHDQLAEGTLHPLCVSFKTDRCVYPMQMTSLAAGPVEVLIWLEAERHYQPETLLSPEWNITLHEGPRLSSYDINTWQLQSIIPKEPIKCITKLRRTFEPSTINQDLYFKEIEYKAFFDPRDDQKVGMAATQIGLWKDRSAIPLLTNYLLAAPHKDAPHIRSVVWALGECAGKRKLPSVTKNTLCDIAKYNPSNLGMECCVALDKAGYKKLAPVIINRLDMAIDQKGFITSKNNAPIEDENIKYLIAWIHAHIDEVRDEYVMLLAKQIQIMSDAFKERQCNDQSIMEDMERNVWLISEAAFIQDQALINHLADLSSIVLNDKVCIENIGQKTCLRAENAANRILVARYACHDTEVTNKYIQWLSEEINVVEHRLRTEDETILTDRYHDKSMYYFRTDQSEYIHDTIENTYATKTEMAALVLPSTLRQEIAEHMLNNAILGEYTTLYYMGWLKTPSRKHIERLKTIWRSYNHDYDESNVKKKLIIQLAGIWNNSKLVNDLLYDTSQLILKEQCIIQLIDLNPERASTALTHIVYLWDKKYASVNCNYENMFTDKFEEDSGLYYGIIKAMLCGVMNDIYRAEYKRLCADKTLHPATRFYLLYMLNMRKDQAWSGPLVERLYDEIAPKASHDDRITLIRMLDSANCKDKMFHELENATDNDEKDELICFLIKTDTPQSDQLLKEILYTSWYEEYMLNPTSNYHSLIERISHCMYYAKDTAKNIIGQAEIDEKLSPGYRACLVCAEPAISMSLIKELEKNTMPKQIHDLLIRKIEDIESYNILKLPR